MEAEEWWKNDENSGDADGGVKLMNDMFGGRVQRRPSDHGLGAKINGGDWATE